MCVLDRSKWIIQHRDTNMKGLFLCLFVCLFVWLFVSTDARVVNANNWMTFSFGLECTTVTWHILGNNFDTTRYKRILQMYGNEIHFATLYDTHNRIPVFSCSSYLLRRKEGDVPHPSVYFIEPQLEDPNSGDNMSFEDRGVEYVNQAVNDNYPWHPVYNKGHVHPVANAKTILGKTATFTLTNIVPQRKDLNGGCWNRVENEIRGYAFNDRRCRDNSIVTGAVPGNELVNGVKIPSYMWSYIRCGHGRNRVVMGFLVPNKANNHVQRMNQLYVYHEKSVEDFLTKISVLYQGREQRNLLQVDYLADRNNAQVRLLEGLKCQGHLAGNQQAQQAANQGGVNENNRVPDKNPARCECPDLPRFNTPQRGHG